MRVVLTLTGVILFCASVATGAGTLIGPAQTGANVGLMLSEPAGLVVLGASFVLIANQVRRKKT